MNGIAFPLMVIKGQLVTATGADLAYMHILAVIQTVTGERLGLIEFGLRDYTFTTYQTFLRVGNDIRERLESAVTDCSFNVISQLDDNGVGVVRINWSYLNEDQQTINLEFQ